MLFIKSLLGLSGAVAGAVVPVVTNRLAQEAPTEVVDFVSNLNVVKSVRKKLAESQKDVKVRMALESLKEKNCKLVVNPKNPDNSFDALHACREKGKTVFYYLGSLESFEKDSETYRPKKVLSVNYKKNSKQSSDHLELTLDGSQKVNLVIENQEKGGWSHFKNVNVNDKCELETPLLGSDLLRCELQDFNGNSSFSYAFSIFK